METMTHMCNYDTMAVTEGEGAETNLSKLGVGGEG